MKRWRLLPFERLTASENMAADEAVFLQNRDGASPPTVRFYTWLHPAVSVGHFQQVYRDIDVSACRRRSVEIVRRPTGGKAVFHGQDLTYAVAGCERRDGFPPDILGTYRMISRCLIRGLAAIGIEACMAEDGRRGPQQPAEAACFSVPSRYELLVKGKKICGSAQLRSGGAFLQHGSMLLDFDARQTGEMLLPQQDDRDQILHLGSSVTSLRQQGAPFADLQTLCAVMQAGFEAGLGIRLEAGTLTAEEASLKARLLVNKYMNDRWNLEGRMDG